MKVGIYLLLYQFDFAAIFKACDTFKFYNQMGWKFISKMVSNRKRWFEKHWFRAMILKICFMWKSPWGAFRNLDAQANPHSNYVRISGKGILTPHIFKRSLSDFNVQPHLRTSGLDEDFSK